MSEIIALINKMSPYLLLGFLLAGVMHAFVPSRLYRRYLGGSSFSSVVNAALLGVPLPLCSCGVIPTAMSLRREGASKGAAVSFLIATPQTGVDSIFATYSLMGLHFALLRPVAALATALLGGQVVNMFDEKDATVVEQAEMQTEQTLTFGGKILKALKYAFVDMMQDIGRWLVVGLVVAGLITVFVPASFFALFADNSLLSMVIVLLFAMPMYLCATGSIPIAVALMLKGLSPGTALVLLMAGPAVNAASMLVVGKMLGRRSLMLYLLSIVGGAMAFGLAVDYLLPREWFTESIDAMAAGAGRGQGWFNIVCSVVMVALLVNALVRRFRKSPEAECGCEACGEEQPSGQTFYVEGMRCNHCRANVEKALAALDGAESAEVDLPTGRAVVLGRVTREQVRTAVEALGFKLKEN